MTIKVRRMRSHLIELARKEETTYYKNFNIDCDLKYDFSNIDNYDKFRDELRQILKFEIDNERPCLTLLVLSSEKIKGSEHYLPSAGFFKYVEKYRKHCTFRGRTTFFLEEKVKLFDFWKDEQKYISNKDFKE
ncbi:hypothetical protein E0I26_08060 [Flavobacterium rhamnosiphilum]|uniref:Uncharacterized protein n=1 Tax=Flavobacterium rhamnosiphilum TaxID=2541724 RepID=A0A4R5F8X3_9FLAO|nr:hypothetical protein [Flavobacterium rhamnosiphilum]TDE44319.1 hypothetical protein E0I26_08060 [Flavobacterium rhamnosiphilum]